MTLGVHVLAKPVDVRAEHLVQCQNKQLPTWLRLTFWAWAFADGSGHARPKYGQLRHDLGLEAQQISSALAHARRKGVLDMVSSARCLVLPGHDLNGCAAEHRVPR